MPRLPDTSNFEPGNDHGFDPIEDSNRKLKIVKSKERTSQKGNRWLKIWFKTDGFPGFIWGDISLNPDKLRKLKEFKLALGLSDDEIDMDELVDQELWGHCFDDEGYASVDKYADSEEGLLDDLPF